MYISHCLQTTYAMRADRN